eukprot:TRINITY_DN26619_c0_g1_i2.p1 TRINITY_DN26619_c0_g1~~TRINITY_DN26619_c0_g1_i2.p1  ORF type:complete len:140 (+),score=27.68 TRINITY_DN26619_c0_g1_i2:174-593(+)
MGYLKGLLKSAFLEQHFEYDFNFDWTSPDNRKNNAIPILDTEIKTKPRANPDLHEDIKNFPTRKSSHVVGKAPLNEQNSLAVNFPSYYRGDSSPAAELAIDSKKNSKKEETAKAHEDPPKKKELGCCFCQEVVGFKKIF